MRVLIIRCGALGDLVYATSIIDALQKEYGKDIIIDFLTSPSAGGIFQKDNRINRVFYLTHKRIPIVFSKEKQQIIQHSKKKPYDILVNFEFGKQFKKLAKSIYASKKVGSFFDEIVIPKEITHMVEITKYIYRNVVSVEVLQNTYPHLIGSDSNNCKEKYALNEKYLVVSPSNSHQKRNILNYRAWEDDKWKELIHLLNKEIQIVIVGGKNEDLFFKKLQPYPNNVVDLVGKTPLPDLIGVIEGAIGVVSTDTGTAHIASATNTEVFTLIGPTPAQQTGPYQTPNNKVHIISLNLDCSPCYKTPRMYQCKNNICMKNISVQKVYNSIKSANIL